MQAAATALAPVHIVTVLSQGGHATETSPWKEWMALNQQVTHQLWVVSSQRHTKPLSSQLMWQLIDVFRNASAWTLLHGHHWGVVDGLHDSGQAAAQVVGLADVHFGWVFQDHCVRWAIQNSGQELAQLYLQGVWKEGKQKCSGGFQSKRLMMIEMTVPNNLQRQHKNLKFCESPVISACTVI